MDTFNSVNKDKYSSNIPDVERYLETIVLAVLAVMSALANSSLWMVILGSRSLRRESNMLLLLSLSLADLLVSCVSMPVTLVTVALARWVFAKETCTVMGFINMLTLVSSVMSLGLISINRYIKICRPRYYRRVYTPPHIFLMTIGVWCLSLILSSPPLYGWCRYDYLPGQSFCFSDWASSISYTFFMVAACFGGPLLMMSFCNVQILKKFRESQTRLHQLPKNPDNTENSNMDSVPSSGASLSPDVTSAAPEVETTRDGSGIGSKTVDFSGLDDVGERISDDDLTVTELTTMTTKTPPLTTTTTTTATTATTTTTTRQTSTPTPSTLQVPNTPTIGRVSPAHLMQQRRKEKRRAEEFQLAISLMVVVVVFVLCWFPFCVTIFISVFAPHALPRAADMFTLLLGYSNSCLNPLIYGVMNKRVKEGYKHLVRGICACLCRRRREVGLERRSSGVFSTQSSD